MEERVFISIGSNLGESRANCERAVEIMRGRSPSVTIIRESSLYTSPPWGVTDQPPFINMALEISTALSPVELLGELKAIERKMGRARGRRWGERIIDLDIVYFGERIISGDELTVPHASRAERAFVLLPISEIAPDFVDPVLGVSVLTLSRRLGPCGVELAK